MIFFAWRDSGTSTAANELSRQWAVRQSTAHRLEIRRALYMHHSDTKLPRAATHNNAQPILIIARAPIRARETARPRDYETTGLRDYKKCGHRPQYPVVPSSRRPVVPRSRTYLRLFLSDSLICVIFSRNPPSVEKFSTTLSEYLPIRCIA